MSPNENEHDRPREESDDPRLDARVHRFVDGEMTTDEARRFEEDRDRDASLGAALAEIEEIRGLLAEAGRTPRADGIEGSPDRTAEPARRHPGSSGRWIPRIVAIAAAVAVVAFSVRFAMQFESGRGDRTVDAPSVDRVASLSGDGRRLDGRRLDGGRSSSESTGEDRVDRVFRPSANLVLASSERLAPEVAPSVATDPATEETGAADAAGDGVEDLGSGPQSGDRDSGWVARFPSRDSSVHVFWVFPGASALEERGTSGGS